MKFKKIFACALAVNMILGPVETAMASSEEIIESDDNVLIDTVLDSETSDSKADNHVVDSDTDGNDDNVEIIDNQTNDENRDENSDSLTSNEPIEKQIDDTKKPSNVDFDISDEGNNSKKVVNDAKPNNTSIPIRDSNSVDETTTNESLDNQKPIDESIRNNQPLYGYFISDDDARSTKFYESRLDDLKKMLDSINNKDDINEYNFKGDQEEEKKNEKLKDYFKGYYYAPDGFENKFTFYKSGLMMPVKNIFITSLYTEKNPRVIFDTQKGDKIYSPINTDQIKRYKNGYVLEDKVEKIKIYITNIDTKEYKDVKAGQLIGTAKDGGISFYIEKDGKFINPALIIRSELDKQLDGFFGLPNMYQTDKTWANERYGSLSISAGACGPSSISMVLSYLTGELVTPSDQVKNLGGAGSPHFINGVGSAFTIFPASANQFNVNQKTLGNNVYNVVEELKKGHPVVLSMHQGFFTTGGHFVVASGIDSDGKIYINDPASKARGELKYTPEFIASNMKNAFSFWNKIDENEYLEKLPEKIANAKSDMNPRAKMQVAIN